MRIVINADDGDEVCVRADYISLEQSLVTLEVENTLYKSDVASETVSLTLDKARELAHALLSVVEAMEFVSTPTEPIERIVNPTFGPFYN
jgi:hypothetical protein